ncbi:c4 zinc finger in nuclear hormone receptors protein [Tyrophagus putrescentiae]|nr:c4 zinc finger in nuclear hormone receptors protein [Tyrophagus putrescentiae]
MEPKVCRVCGDSGGSGGFNYNAGNLSCKPCKIFFCRNYNKLKILKCSTKTDNCLIDYSNRRFCSRCRLLKCLKIGMKKAIDESSLNCLVKDNSNFDQLFLSRIISLSNNSTLNSAVLKQQKQMIITRMRRKRRTPQRLSIHEQQVLEQLQNALAAAFEDERQLPVVKRVSTAEEAFNQHCLYARRIVKFIKILVLRCAFNYSPHLQGYPMIEDESGARAVFLPLSKNLSKEGHQLKRQNRALYYGRNQVWLIHPQLENDEKIRDLLIAQALFQPLSGASSSADYQFNRYKSILYNYLQLKYHNRQRAQLKFCSLQNILKEFANLTKNSKLIFTSKFKNLENANEILKDLFNLM